MSDITGRWRRIYSNEWHAASFQGLDDAERVVYFYCRTGGQSTSVGVYRMSTAVAVEDIGNLTAVDFDYRLGQVCTAFDWRFDTGTRVLWMPNWIVENPPQSPNVCKSWRKLLANLPDCDIKIEAADTILRALKDMPKAFADSFGNLPRELRISKARPKSLPESNQGVGSRGAGYSGKQRTGGLRPVAMNGDNQKLHIARLTIKQFGEDMDIEELIDHFHHVRRTQNGNGNTDDWKRGDIVQALSIAIAEKRAGIQ